MANQLYWSANTIAELYKSRCQVEIFFQDIKQLLHIKSFIGISENIVMIQIWIALITIIILKALKAQSKFDWYLSNLVAFISLNLFVKIDLQKWLDKPFGEHINPPPESTKRVPLKKNNLFKA
ncbi:transposase [Cloacibacterium sp.]|uniref:transposase n=1 Tax=Cloacibacterium sp. TaxID=1913682 RepID=UPI0039E400BB